MMRRLREKTLRYVSDIYINKAKFKKISRFWVTGLKVLGRDRTHHIFFNCFFFWKKIYNFMHFERHFAFQNA